MSFENQIKEILKARLEGTATEEELAILREWLDRSPQNRELAELLEESAENLPLLGRIYGYDEQRVWGNIRKAARRRRMRMLAATARKYAAVAAVAALLAGGGWWTLGRRAERLARQAYIEQLTPGVRGAVLTLSSGENVALEAGGQRMLVEQDGTRLEIAGEELAYHKVEAEQEIPMTNTVTVPRGKEFSLRLSDGTQVYPRIRIRGARLAVLKEVMNASDKIRIQYANKYAGSSNYWKNSIGMNRAIIDNDVLGTKAAQEAKFAEFAKEKNNADYATVVKKIDDLVAKTAPLNYQFTCLRETFFGAIEFGSVMLAKTREALIEKNDSLIKVRIEALKDTYESIHNKDYDHEVDRKVAKVLFPLYAEMIPADQRLSIYKVIEQKYKGNYDKFVDDMYDNSIFSNRENFEKFVKKPSVKAIDNDLALQYCQSKYDQFEKIVSQLEDMDKELTLLHKTYIRGLGEMKQPVPSYPDANFTIRLTYGNVKPYDPKDGVHYNYYTTTKGILEKENPEDREFVVPAKLKELIEKKDYGRYALPNGDMPVCFLSTNDITGGNSGSPVLNENGELIGCAFDGNWESLSGDINFDNNLQRCINLDIRYVLFILEKLGNCGHLINEMTIVE